MVSVMDVLGKLLSTQEARETRVDTPTHLLCLAPIT